MLASQIKTASDLRMFVEESGNDKFFSRKSMKFFGDTMKNYGVRKVQITTCYDESGNYVGKDGMKVEAWELYRRHPVKFGNQGSAYFDCVTFRRIHPAT